MNTAVLIAIVAAVGNLLQGWDSASMAGAVIHIKKEFKWETEPMMEGLSVAMSLIGATFITLCSGGVSDWLGRRPMLTASSVFYIISGLLALWSPNVYLLLFARLLDGFGIGLAVTFVPLYISEMAPPEIRGSLSTLPQFTYSSGFFLSYSFAFCMSLTGYSNWRFMLGVVFAPSLIYCASSIFYLPESPRWLMSKGRMLEARQVLQRLRRKQDVSGEMALLVEGLEVGQETAIEEYVIGPPADEEEQKEEIKLLGPEGGVSSVVAVRVTGQSFVGSAASPRGSVGKQTSFLSTDPVVALLDSMHEKLPETGSKVGSSTLFPTLGSMFGRNDSEWDEASRARHEEGYASGAGEADENLRSPLISRQATGQHPLSGGSSFKTMSRFQSYGAEGADIGGGWHLAWKWKEGESGTDGNKKEGSFKRVYLHEEQGSRGPLDGEFVKASALVSQSALCTEQLTGQQPVGPATIHPSAAAATKGPQWKDLFEPGVKHALLVGMGIQMVQQFLGINGVLYYTPQILDQAGVQVLLSKLGLSSTSSSLLISAVMTMLMLPCVGIAMRLMDVSGRRSLLLNTNPVLTASLLILVAAKFVNIGNTAKAAFSTFGVISYSCFFAMGFGPIPNILCAEIFPTKVRGTCIALCAATFWISNIVVTYTLPVMLSTIGLAGVFSIFAVMSLVSWAFVFFKVPETKGMPLEVITEFFALGAKHKIHASANDKQ